MSADIPFFATAREWEALAGELVPAMTGALATGRSLQGPDVVAFEDELAAWTGRRHAVAVGSGTDALHFALVAGGVRPGDDVLVPAFSFIASASCVLRTGARPVFVDVDEDGLLDLGDADRKRTDATTALVAVQLYGQMIAPGPLENFAAAHGILLVEDAAQALGAHRGGRRAGGVGAVSACSFDPTKTLAAPGSGGAVLTDDDRIAERVRRLRWHGRDGSGAFVELGHNSQLPSASAAALRVKLRHQGEWAARRASIAALYDEALDSGGPRVRERGTHVFHKYVARVADREAARMRLEAAGVPTLVHYATPLHRQPVFSGARPGACPHADALAREVLSLPIHAFLRDDEVERVVAAVRAAVPASR